MMVYFMLTCAVLITRCTCLYVYTSIPMSRSSGLEMGHSMASKLMLGVVVPLRGGVLALALAVIA